MNPKPFPNPDQTMKILFITAIAFFLMMLGLAVVS